MRLLNFFLIAFILLFHHSAYSQVEKYMAAFTYQICKSTTWPTLQGEFVIGVVGKSSVTPYFQQMTAEKKLGNNTILLTEWRSVNEVGKCNVLFVSKDQTSQLSTIVGKFSGEPVLIVTENSGTIKNGACVSFSLIDNKIRYELNKTASQHSKLSITGELERMALKVY